MKRVVFVVLFFIGGQIALPGQVPALWNNAQLPLLFYGFTFDDTGTHMIVSGTRNDSCYNGLTTLVVIDTAGTLVLDTGYDLVNCWNDTPWRFTPNANGPGYYMITLEDTSVSAGGYSYFVYFVDSSFALQWKKYIGRDLRSQILSYSGRNYISMHDGSDRNVLRFYQPGIVDTFTQVTHPYFNGAPRHIFADNGSIYEIDYRDYDSAFVCMVYDTLGNFQNSFSFDANANAGEGIQYIALHNNRLFHVNSSAFSSTVYPASTDLSGNVNWIGTVNYQYKGASLDTINDVGYILTTSASGNRLFSYDFNTGARIDSITIDSVFINNARIKSGPAPGVFLFYRQLFTNALLVDQYDAHFNRIWQGYVSHPTCTLACSPYDLNFDALGNVYTVSYCSNSCVSDSTLLVSKFSPSLVSVPESNPEQHVSLFPNPANSEVRVQLNVQSGNSRVNILNSLGEIVLRKSFTGNNATLDITGLPSGLYLVEIISDSEQHFTQKLIIQHP